MTILVNIKLEKKLIMLYSRYNDDEILSKARAVSKLRD